MKLALLGDIHSNLHALNAVAADLRDESPDLVVCTGDIVGYGAFPAECVAWVREHCDRIVRGNHDHFTAGSGSAFSFNPRARTALTWTAEHLSAEDITWLGELPLKLHEENVQIVHGHPILPEAWLYILERRQADAALESVEEKVIVVGHSHIQGCFRFKSPTVELTPGVGVELDDRRAVLNPGSVGQPRDGDPRAAFAILDTGSWIYTPRRVEYDIQAARQAILDADLPRELGDRLLVGY